MGEAKKSNSEGAAAARPSRRGFYIAAVAYAAWLIFLAVLVLMQRRLQ
jgi:hypothetical protein